MQVDDIHAVVTVSGLCSTLALADTTLDVKHSFVLVETEQLFFSNTVQHVLKDGDEVCN